MTENQNPQTPDNLSRIVDLANQLTQAQTRVEQLEEQLDAAKTLKRKIETEHLPELMREMGLTSVALSDGTTVTVSEEFDCGITQSNHSAAIAWLDGHGFGGLIRTRLLAAFSRDDRSIAVELSKKLSKAIRSMNVDAPCELAETVHPSTLKSFIKDELEKGTPIPFDLFSIHPYSKAKIKRK